MSGLPVRACTRARLQSSLPFAARQSLQRRYASSESDSLEEAVNVKSVLDIGRDLSMKVPKTKPLVRIRGLGFWRDKPTKPAEENDTTSTLELPKEKRIEDSFVSFDLPFESDQSLHEIYVGGMTSIRVGRLFEDLDTLAGSVAYRHVLPEGASQQEASKALYLVTAAVDRLDMLRPLSATDPEDLRLSGWVSYTSRSSLEIFVKLESVSARKGLQDSPETLLLGRFTMACRDAATGKAKAIPQLIATTPQEVALQKLGKNQKDKKIALAQTSLDSHQPNEAESARLYKLFMGNEALFEGRAPKPDSMLWMSETASSSQMLMHPQERNRHNKIFGGYLMRLAYETAFTTASLFARDRVTFLALDELAFRCPVEIGSLLRMDSKIAFTPTEGEHHSFQVSVEASTIAIRTGEKKITNIFHFTFVADKPLTRYILPKTYNEGIDWLGAMRRRAAGQEIRKLYSL